MTNHKYCNIAGYVRISHSQDFTSEDRQKHIIMNFCKVNEWTINALFVDHGYAGTTKPISRGAFHEMMETIKDFDAIAISSLSIIGRTTADILSMIKEYLDPKDIHLISINDRFNSSNAMDRLFLEMHDMMIPRD